MLTLCLVNSVGVTDVRQTADKQQSETDGISRGRDPGTKVRLILCYLTDACLLYPITKPLFMFLPFSLLEGKRAARQRELSVSQSQQGYHGKG